MPVSLSFSDKKTYLHVIFDGHFVSGDVNSMWKELHTLSNHTTEYYLLSICVCVLLHTRNGSAASGFKKNNLVFLIR